MRKFDPEIIRQQIDNLLVAFPEMAEDEILRADMIEAETDFNSYLRMLERKRREAITNAEALRMNIDLDRQRKEKFERRDEAIRSAMFKAMQWGELKKVELPEATLSIRAGTPKVMVFDEAAIPDELCRFKREVDKAKLKEALLDLTKPVPGATLSNAEPTIAIRIK